MRTRRRPAPALVPVVESMVLRPGLGAGGGEEEERGEGLAEARTAADAPAEADDHSRGEQDCTSIFFVGYFISFFFFFSPQCARWLIGCAREKKGTRMLLSFFFLRTEHLHSSHHH
jgi:hypothetical protein